MKRKLMSLSILHSKKLVSLSFLLYIVSYTLLFILDIQKPALAIALLASICSAIANIRLMMSGQIVSCYENISQEDLNELSVIIKEARDRIH